MRLLRFRTTAAALTTVVLAALTAGCGTAETTKSTGSTGSKSSEAGAGGTAAKVPAQLKFSAKTVDGKAFEGS
jgi:hypothetical protein